MVGQVSGGWQAEKEFEFAFTQGQPNVTVAVMKRKCSSPLGGGSDITPKKDVIQIRIITCYPMKILLLTFVFLLPSATAFCQSALYSFSGRVTGIHRDGAGTIAALGWAVGDPVSVSFEVDFAMPGMERLNDGSVSALAPVVWEEGRIDYFFARMVAGTLLPEVNGGMYNDPENVSENLAGWNRADWQGNRGVLYGGSQDSHFRLERFDPWPGGIEDWQVQQWQVGTALQGFITGFSDLDYSMMQADMRLDSIIAVPEPGVPSLLLLGGLSWLICGGREANRWSERGRATSFAYAEALGRPPRSVPSLSVTADTG